MASKSFRSFTYVLLICSLLCFLSGCASKKPFWGDSKSGYIMMYRIDPSEVWTYESESEQNMIMEMMGSTMETTTDVFLGYRLIGKESAEDENIETILIPDSTRIAVQSGMGDRDFDLSALIGKSFGLTFTRLGKKIAFTDPEQIEIEFGQMGGGKRNSESFFNNLLPDLPAEPVKIGDSWNEKKDEPLSQGGMDLTIRLETNHTLEEIETIGGLECLKIVSKSKGTIDGTGQQMGAEFAYEGDVESSSVWYFAYKKGMFVQSESTNLTEGSIAVSGPQDMTLPMTQETTSMVRALF